MPDFLLLSNDNDSGRDVAAWRAKCFNKTTKLADNPVDPRFPLREFNEEAPYRYIVIAWHSCSGPSSSALWMPGAQEATAGGSLSTVCLGEEEWFNSIRNPMCLASDPDRRHRYFKITFDEPPAAGTGGVENYPLYVDMEGAREINKAFCRTNRMRARSRTFAVLLKIQEHGARLAYCVPRVLRSGMEHMLYGTLMRGTLVGVAETIEVGVETSPRNRVMLRHPLLVKSAFPNDLAGFAPDYRDAGDMEWTPEVLEGVSPLDRKRYRTRVAESRLASTPEFQRSPFESFLSANSDEEMESSQIDGPSGASGSGDTSTRTNLHGSRSRSRSRRRSLRHNVGPRP